jgi:hypothetical protein
LLGEATIHPREIQARVLALWAEQPAQTTGLLQRIRSILAAEHRLHDLRIELADDAAQVVRIEAGALSADLSALLHLSEELHQLLNRIALRRLLDRRTAAQAVQKLLNLRAHRVADFIAHLSNSF